MEPTRTDIQHLSKAINRLAAVLEAMHNLEVKKQTDEDVPKYSRYIPGRAP
jgi:hypothetical protein